MSFGRALAGFIITVVGLYVSLSWQELGSLQRIGCIAVMGAALFILYDDYKEQKKRELIDRINARIGTMTDLKGATMPAFRIGHTGATFILVNGTFGFPPLLPNVLQCYVKENRLFVNIVIKDPKGKVIAVIDKNEWTVFQSDYEYNNDDTAFELVTQGDRTVFFQIHLQDGVAHLTGMIYSSSGHGMGFYDIVGEQGSTMTIVFPENPFVLPEVRRIFKYPRGKYLSVRQ